MNTTLSENIAEAEEAIRELTAKRDKWARRVRELQEKINTERKWLHSLQKEAKEQLEIDLQADEPWDIYVTPKEEKVVRWRVADRLTFREIGSRLHLTAERVRQINAKAMRKLRNPKRVHYRAEMLAQIPELATILQPTTQNGDSAE